MLVRQTPDEYLWNMEVLTPAEAKRMWKDRIKSNWGYQCAYCGSTENLTLDHVKPRSLGGPDTSKNVVCACRDCNHSKGHEEWREWYEAQHFYNWERMKSLEAWIQEPKKESAYKRRNVCYANAS